MKEPEEVGTANEEHLFIVTSEIKREKKKKPTI